ncbi:MAG TPA: hypothetical protein VN109_10670 [Devosia sp.]|jgi:hypothetical protein|nr:hypothetical protein [Devosia sp.]
MKKIIIAASVAALSLGTTAVAVAPAQAAPMYHRGPVFEPHGDWAYYNGHRGYKKWHHGYRYYDGYWFPPAAFIAAGIAMGITGAIIHNLVTHH